MRSSGNRRTGVSGAKAAAVVSHAERPDEKKTGHSKKQQRTGNQEEKAERRRPVNNRFCITMRIDERRETAGDYEDTEKNKITRAPPGQKRHERHQYNKVLRRENFCKGKNDKQAEERSLNDLPRTQ